MLCFWTGKIFSGNKTSVAIFPVVGIVFHLMECYERFSVCHGIINDSVCYLFISSLDLCFFSRSIYLLSSNPTLSIHDPSLECFVFSYYDFRAQCVEPTFSMRSFSHKNGNKTYDVRTNVYVQFFLVCVIAAYVVLCWV